MKRTVFFTLVVLCLGTITDTAFAVSRYTITGLGTLGGSNSGAVGLNDLGQVVGRADTAGATEQHAFIWQNGALTDLGTLGGTYSHAYDINCSEKAVGLATTATGDYHAFLWQGGVMTDISTLPGNMTSWAQGINESGQIVGISGSHAFLWEDGVMSNLGTLTTSTMLAKL